MPSLNQLVKRLLVQYGFDIDVHRCTNHPYNGPNIAFVHIAKCGGVSIDTALRGSLANLKERRIDREASLIASLSDFTQKINSIDSACDFSEYHAIKLQRLFDQYLALNWQYVSGHVAVNTDTLNRYKEKYAFVTMLRDPVERFISNYIFNKLTNTNTFMLPNNLSTDNVIKEAHEIIGSRRGWHIANIPTMCITGSFPSNIEQAKLLNKTFSENISKFAVVGFLNQTDSFTNQIESLTGRKINICHKNSINNISNAQSNEIKTTLKTFFHQQNTKSKLNKLCKFESINYQNALNNYG